MVPPAQLALEARALGQEVLQRAQRREAEEGEHEKGGARPVLEARDVPAARTRQKESTLK